MTGPRSGFLGGGTMITAVLALAVLAPAAALAGPPQAQPVIAEATAGACAPGASILCLGGSRFAVSVEWRDFSGNTGSGKAIPLTGDTGYFWFFTNTNVELVVKVLDATAINGHFWVFYGALSNVEYTITVTDTATSAQKIYSNLSGEFASAGDTMAFESSVQSAPAGSNTPVGLGDPPELGPSPAASVGAASKARTTGCVADSTALCLAAGRFRVEVNWTDFQGKTGRGQAVGLTADTGYFWFFNDTNVELVVKVLDARVLNGKFWVFYGALSNVEYEIVVIDTTTGESVRYLNPSGTFASAGDTKAFPVDPAEGVAALTAVGSPVGSASTASIGPSGGALTSLDGRLTLSVPAGALSSAVGLTIQGITNEAPGGLGNAYRLTPDGQTFAVAANLVFHYGDADLAGTAPEGLAIAYQDDQHFWRTAEPSVLDQAGRTVTVATSHLTDWSFLQGYQLRPGQASVQVGKTLGLQLVVCTLARGPGSFRFLSQCAAPPAGGVSTFDWEVNDVPGGNATIGTVFTQGQSAATYLAPAAKPTPSTVAVSAQLNGEVTNAANTRVVSNVSIVDSQWTGTSVGTFGPISGHSELVWSLESTTNKVSIYHSSGTATMALAGCTVSPDHGAIDPLGILTIDNNSFPATYSGTAGAFWPATFACTGQPPFQGVGSVLSFDANGNVSADGLTIQGNDRLSLDGVWRISWTFNQQ